MTCYTICGECERVIPHNSVEDAQEVVSDHNNKQHDDGVARVIESIDQLDEYVEYLEEKHTQEKYSVIAALMVERQVASSL